MDDSREQAVSSVLARVRRLRLRSVRDRTGLHYLEGFRAFLQAADAGIGIDTIVYCERLARNPAVQKRVRWSKREGVRVVRVTPEEFRRGSVALRASGIGAIVRQHWTPLERADAGAGSCWIALSSLRSPGNAGTIFRTAEAAGAAGVILLGDGLDPFDPAVVRASMGGVFRLRLVRTTLREFGAWASARGCRVLGTSASAASLYTEVPVGPPLVVLFGEERRGLGAEERAVCTDTARIPIVGAADSLNVGVAAGVMLFEVLRRRVPPSGTGGTGGGGVDGKAPVG
jgi:TrmH family RNA methyltransferase